MSFSWSVFSLAKKKKTPVTRVTGVLLSRLIKARYDARFVVTTITESITASLRFALNLIIDTTYTNRRRVVKK